MSDGVSASVWVPRLRLRRETPKGMRIAWEDDVPELMDVVVPVPVEKLVGREIEVTACAKALQVSTAF